MSSKVQDTKKVVSSDAFKYNFKFWRLLGVYPVKGFRFLYVLIITLSSSLPVGMTIFLFYLENLKDILENLALNITAIAINLKFANILIKRRNILDVNTCVHELDTRASSAQEQECLRSAVHVAHKIFYLTCTMFAGAVFLGELGLFFSQEKKVLCLAWYPFEWKYSTWKYSVVHLHQSVALTLFIFQNVSNDTFPAIYMLVLTSHVKTLNIRIRRLGMDAAEPKKNVNGQLIQCIKDQQMLFEYFRTVRKATSAAIFLQVFVTGLEACIIAICAFFVNDSFFEKVFFGEYLLCVILEIFLYCHFGNQLAYESDLMSDAIYSCNWVNQDKRFKRNLIMFMQSTQKTMTIIAGGIFPVNLSTFVSVLKSSYSLFAVLAHIT